MRRGQAVEAELHQRPVAVAQREALEPEPSGDQRVGDAERLQRLEGVGVDHCGTRGVLPLGQPIDQQMADAGLSEGDGEGEAGRAGADDQDIGGGGKHGGSPGVAFCQRLLTYAESVAFVNRR